MKCDCQGRSYKYNSSWIEFTKDDNRRESAFVGRTAENKSVPKTDYKFSAATSVA